MQAPDSAVPDARSAPLALFGARWKFAQLPSLYMHKSWRPLVIPHACADWLFESEQLQARLSTRAIDIFELPACTEEDFLAPGVGPAMGWSDTDIRQLAYSFSRRIVSGAVKRSIERGAVRAWRCILDGREQDALYRHSDLDVPAALVSSFSMACRPSDYTDRPEALGLNLLQRIISAPPTAIACRLRLKLPRHWAGQRNLNLADDAVEEGWRWLTNQTVLQNSI